MAVGSLVSEAKEFIEAATSPILQATHSRETRNSSGDTKALLRDAADGLVMEVTKIAVMFGGSGSVSEQHAKALLEIFQQRFAALCAVVHGIVVGSGTTMCTEITGAVKGLLRSCEAFLDDLNREESKSKLPQRVGVVKERCEVLKRAPLDEKVALGRKLTLCARQLKDVHREVKDLLMKICAREQERCRREEETEEEGDSEGEGISDSDEDWKFLELEVVVATEQVAGELVSMLSAVIKMLLEGPMPMGEDLEGWESVAFHCKTLETTANDLVAELQGSRDGEQLSSASEALATGKELILEDLPASVSEQHGSVVAAIDRRLTARQEELKRRVDMLLLDQRGELVDILRSFTQRGVPNQE